MVKKRLEVEIESLSKINESAQSAIAKLDSELKASLASGVQLQESLVNLNLEIKQLNGDRDSLREDLRALNEEKDALEGRCAALHAKNGSLESKIDGLENVVSEL